ncbi:MAG: L-threonylcarbamoyladenylate synthase [bacterium]
MQIVSVNDENLIKKVVSVLSNSGLIIFPTETCYGVGVDATNELSVSKLLEYKRRPEGKAISVAVSDKEMAYRYVELNDIANNIYNNFLPGPVTVISKLKLNGIDKIAKGIASENGNLGVRIPNYEKVIEIIKAYGKPITATSANSSGAKTPYKISDILDNLSDKQRSLIDLIIDANELPHNPPSSVVDTTKDEMKTLREGSVSFEKLILEVETEGEIETREIASKFIARFKSILNTKCLLILFNASMGAGKTIFVKSIAEELGVKDIVRSPTFNLIKQYNLGNEKNGKLIHIDAWRIESEEEFEKLKIQEYLTQGNIVAIEWAGGVSSKIREQYINSKDNENQKELIVVGIDIEYLSETKRKIVITRI